MKLRVTESSEDTLDEAERAVRERERALIYLDEARFLGSAERTDALLAAVERAYKAWEACPRWRVIRRFRTYSAWMALSSELHRNERIRSQRDRHVWVQG